MKVAGIFRNGWQDSPEYAQVNKDVDADRSSISSMNKQLGNYPISGFGYKSSKLDFGKWDMWAKNAAPLVREIISKLPDGYVLQVTGHTDSTGPEQPEGNKPGNIKISAERAKTVFDALKKGNIESSKITYKGIGSSELLKNFDSSAAEQRRVSFKVVAK